MSTNPWKSNFWWKADKGATHEAVFDSLKRLIGDQQYRMESHLRHLRFYSNRAAESLFGGQYLETAAKQKLTENLVKSIIDTVVAHYGTEQVKLTFRTKRGDWSQAQLGRRLGAFIEGAFESNGVWRKMRRVFKDSCIFGLGFLHVYRDQDQIDCERVFPPQVVFDEREALDGDPRHLFRFREVSREGLLERLDLVRYATDIKAAGNLQVDPYVRDDNEDDRVTLVEAWRLPSKNGKRPGRYVAALNTVALIDTDWTSQRFPFAMLPWHGDETQGVWPQSLVDEVEPIQIETNRLLQKQERQLMAGSFKILAERGSKIVKSHLTDQDGTLLEYTGTPPQAVALAAVQPELWRQRQELKQDAYDLTGVNRLAATGLKPAGLNAAVAIRDYVDLGSKRMQDVAQTVQETYREVGFLFIERAVEIAESGNAGPAIMARNKRGWELIKWSDVSSLAANMDQYILGTYPTNYFSTTPSAKKEEARELVSDGILSVEEWAAINDFPDLESTMGRRTAPIRVVEMVIEQLLDGEAVTPEPYYDLQLCMRMVTEAYLQAKTDGAPEETLDNIRRFLDLTIDMMRMQQPPQAQPGPGAGPQPQPAAAAPQP